MFGSPSFLHSSIVHISYPPHSFLHPLHCARAFYYTFRLSFVSLLHTPIAHISFVHIGSSTSSLLHSVFSTQSDLHNAFTTHPDSTQLIHHIPFLHSSIVHANSVGTTRTSISHGQGRTVKQFIHEQWFWRTSECSNLGFFSLNAQELRKTQDYVWQVEGCAWEPLLINNLFQSSTLPVWDTCASCIDRVYVHNRAVQERDVVNWLCWIGMCSKGIVHNRFVSKKQSVLRKMWMTECAQTKYGQSGCVVTRRMTIEMCSKRRVRNREGVETDVVDTKCALSSCVGKRGCPLFSWNKFCLRISC